MRHGFQISSTYYRQLAHRQYPAIGDVPDLKPSQGFGKGFSSSSISIISSISTRSASWATNPLFKVATDLARITNTSRTAAASPLRIEHGKLSTRDQARVTGHEYPAPPWNDVERRHKPEDRHCRHSHSKPAKIYSILGSSLRFPNEKRIISMTTTTATLQCQPSHPQCSPHIRLCRKLSEPWMTI